MKSAVCHLENHPDRDRIQKLLYFVYTKSWTTDVSILNKFSIRRLLKLLVDESASIKQLEMRLIGSAERLNKANTYVQLAHSIIEPLQRSQKFKEPISTSPYNRFKLRYVIMQVLNPYKAKAVLIALYRSTSSVSDEKSISVSSFAKVSFDELLRKVMLRYPSFEALELGLENLDQLPLGVQSSEGQQLGQTLKEALRPYLQADGLQVPHKAPDLDSDPESLCTILMSPQMAGSHPIGKHIPPGEVA